MITNKKLLKNLEVSKNLLIFAAESPLGCKILGSVAEKQLRNNQSPLV
jgi:hypothetical protein